MNICLVTPAAKASRSGNRVTANRWSRILRQLGHRVQVCTSYEPTGRERPNLLVAIHAWRSAKSIATFKARQPDMPVVVLLAGTDVYRFQADEPETTLASMQVADRLVGLHDRVNHDIPAEFGPKLRVIYQSSRPLPQPRKPVRRWFQICVVGGLREEKDPLRTALAARRMPNTSRLRVVHLGGAHTEAWAKAADKEMRVNPRYRWRGEVSRAEVRRCFGRSHAMVISSVMEGGANVVSEAMVAGLPVLASEISGNLGLLGDHHPALYPARDDSALAALLQRAEHETSFLPEVAACASARAERFSPEREFEAWRSLIAEL